MCACRICISEKLGIDGFSGVMTCVDKELEPTVVYNHPSGRALGVAIKLEKVRIVILNIYAPTDLRRRATFWSALASSDPEVDSRIVGGDFNDLEALEDQQGRAPDVTSLRKNKGW